MMIRPSPEIAFACQRSLRETGSSSSTYWEPSLRQTQGCVAPSLRKIACDGAGGAHGLRGGVRGRIFGKRHHLVGSLSAHIGPKTGMLARAARKLADDKGGGIYPHGHGAGDTGDGGLVESRDHDAEYLLLRAAPDAGMAGFTRILEISGPHPGCIHGVALLSRSLAWGSGSFSGNTFGLAMLLLTLHWHANWRPEPSS